MSLRWEEKSNDELERYFIEEYERLRRSNDQFDLGRLSDAPAISSIIMKIVYDSGSSSVSLLKHMGLKQHNTYIDSSYVWQNPNPSKNSTIISKGYHLISAQITFDGQNYKPFYDRHPVKKVDFDTWWDGIVLSKYDDEAPDNRETISRGELLKFVRNEEAGAHISNRYRRGSPEDKLARLMLGEYVDGYMSLNNGPPVTAEPYAPAYATLRQIGWEIQKTMEIVKPELIARANLQPSNKPRLRPAPSEMLGKNELD